MTEVLFPDERRRFSQREMLDYVFQAEPDVVMVNRFVVLSAGDSLPKRIEKDPRLRRDYVMRFQLGDWVTVYERKRMMRGPVEIPSGLTVRDHLDRS